MDVLNVASPAPMWGEWIACGGLLVFVVLTVDGKPKLTKVDLLVIVSFFISLAAGFFIIPSQSVVMGHYWLFLSCLACFPLRRPIG